MKAIQLNNGEFAHRYFATEEGQIWDKENMKYVPQTLNMGCMNVNLAPLEGKVKFVKVHRAVLSAFEADFNVKAEKRYVVDHFDGNPHNNILSNLQHITQAENLAKGKKPRRTPILCINKVTSESFIVPTQMEAGRRTGIHFSDVGKIVRGHYTRKDWHFERVEK